MELHPPELRDFDFPWFRVQSLLEAETVVALLWFEARVSWFLSVSDPTEECIESRIKSS
jgi:hypothetical protein